MLVLLNLTPERACRAAKVLSSGSGTSGSDYENIEETLQVREALGHGATVGASLITNTMAPLLI